LNIEFNNTIFVAEYLPQNANFNGVHLSCARLYTLPLVTVCVYYGWMNECMHACMHLWLYVCMYEYKYMFRCM